MYCRLIHLDKRLGVHLVGIGETWRHLFAKCVLRFTGPKATNECKDDHICDGFKVEIDRAVHGVLAIWDVKFSTEDWIFLLLDTNSAFNEMNRIGMLWKV